MSRTARLFDRARVIAPPFDFYFSHAGDELVMTRSFLQERPDALGFPHKPHGFVLWTVDSFIGRLGEHSLTDYRNRLWFPDRIRGE